jgi:hypothetical protein
VGAKKCFWFIVLFILFSYYYYCSLKSRARTVPLDLWSLATIGTQETECPKDDGLSELARSLYAEVQPVSQPFPAARLRVSESHDARIDGRA